MARHAGARTPRKLARRDVVWAGHPVPLAKSEEEGGWDQATEFPARESAGLQEQVVETTSREATRGLPLQSALIVRSANLKSRAVIPRSPPRPRQSRARKSAVAPHSVPETPVARD